MKQSTENFENMLLREYQDECKRFKFSRAFLLALHTTCIILYAICAYIQFTSDDSTSTIVYVVCAVSWLSIAIINYLRYTSLVKDCEHRLKNFTLELEEKKHEQMAADLL